MKINTQIKIGIAEDHQVMIDGITSLLDEFDDVEVVLTAINGKILIDQLKTEKPDVILMDINMPEMDGLEATKHIKKHYPEINVVVLSMHDDLRLIKELLKIGADGYVLKNTGIQEIRTAIATVAKGETYFCKPIADKIMKSLMHNSAITVSKENIITKVSLTPREHEVLKLICREYTSSEIAGELFISINTVESHRKNLLRKLNCKNSVGLVKWALQSKVI